MQRRRRGSRRMEEHTLPPGAAVFKYKLDFYYQQALLYLVTLLLYGGIRGTITFERLPSLGADPILYIIILFVIISFVVRRRRGSRRMEEHTLPPGAAAFKYKLDFYYQQALLYLVTLLLYGGMRGTITFERLPSLEGDRS